MKVIIFLQVMFITSW